MKVSSCFMTLENRMTIGDVVVEGQTFAEVTQEPGFNLQ
jgi:hypothetical protein